MAAKKKKRKRAAMVEGLTREEMYEMMEEMYKAIEAARYAIDDIGEFDMESGEEGYTIRLSRHVKGRVTYDPRTGRIVIMLPDTTQWRQNPDGRWDRSSLGMHVDAMEKLHEARQQVHWLEGEIRRLQSLASLPNDPRQREAARQLAALSRQAYEQQNTMQRLEWLYMSAVSRPAA